MKSFLKIFCVSMMCISMGNAMESTESTAPCCVGGIFLNARTLRLSECNEKLVTFAKNTVSEMMWNESVEGEVQNSWIPVSEPVPAGDLGTANFSRDDASGAWVVSVQPKILSKFFDLIHLDADVRIDTPKFHGSANTKEALSLRRVFSDDGTSIRFKLKNAKLSEIEQGNKNLYRCESCANFSFSKNKEVEKNNDNNKNVNDKQVDGNNSKSNPQSNAKRLPNPKLRVPAIGFNNRSPVRFYVCE